MKSKMDLMQECADRIVSTGGNSACCDDAEDICTKASVAEHARLEDDDNPCTCI